VLCPDTRSTDKHGGFQKLSSRHSSHLQRPQIKIYLFEVKEWFFTLVQSGAECLPEVKSPHLLLL
jgi:hypothetical protein